jgi:hypothetical protein
MKTTRFLLVVIGLGALTFGQSLAGEPSRLSSDREARPNHSSSVHPAAPGHGGGEQADRNHPLLKGLGHVPEKSGQIGPLHIPPKSASATALHPPAFKKSGATANAGRMMNKLAGYHEQLAKLPVGREAALPVSGLVHGRSTAAAAIGGPMAASAKTAATGLNGSALKRKL